MRRDPRWQASRFSLWRSLIIALVLCLHGGLWMAVRWLAEPWAPATSAASAQTAQALSVRLLDPPERRDREVSAPVTQHAVDHRLRKLSRNLAPVVVASSATMMALPPPMRDLQPTRTQAATGADAQPGHFIPGGTGFQQQLQAATAPPHVGLPDNTLAHAPHFAMADPRTHGLAGLARALQHITGVVDKVCLNADVDSHMSDQELLEHHLSRAELRQMILVHNCNVKGGLP